MEKQIMLDKIGFSPTKNKPDKVSTSTWVCNCKISSYKLKPDDFYFIWNV